MRGKSTQTRKEAGKGDSKFTLLSENNLSKGISPLKVCAKQIRWRLIAVRVYNLMQLMGVIG